MDLRILYTRVFKSSQNYNYFYKKYVTNVSLNQF